LELMQKFEKQAKDLGVKFAYQEVLKIKPDKTSGGFVVETKKGNYACKKIIYAGGSKRIELGAKGEKEFLGKGVSYCSTCDAGFYKNKNVSVIGGSNAALTSALLVSKYAKKVYLIHRGSDFQKAEPSWIEEVEKNKKIEVKFNEEVVEIYGSKFVEGVKLKSGNGLDCEGVFIEIGGVPQSYVLESLGLKMNKSGFIITDKEQRTNINGFYSAGDVTDNVLKQIITACGEGSVAVLSAYRDLKKK